ncbi:MAG: helix-turn-helix domain-containing protein [Bdellovibrionaceae bacterium]|nr:helix-turn-helix domain-containing protein [Pseudobdellovibrionaceae bacterium]
MKTKIALPYSRKIGRFFQDHRIKAGLSQSELANALGVNKQLISNWERGLCSPRMDHVGKIIKLTKIPKAKLLTILLDQSEAEIRKSIRA